MLAGPAWAYEAGLVGEHDELGPVADIELGQDAADVGAGGGLIAAMAALLAFIAARTTVRHDIT